MLFWAPREIEIIEEAGIIVAKYQELQEVMRPGVTNPSIRTYYGNR